jgi:citrate lyase beta subunit
MVGGPEREDDEESVIDEGAESPAGAFHGNDGRMVDRPITERARGVMERTKSDRKEDQ